MADEDEIDVLGDFNLDNFLTKNDTGLTLVSQNTDLLNCDYTIHPQWLLDKPSANPDCWYEPSTTVLSSDLTEKTPVEVAGNGFLGHVSTENSINDESGWTEKEKNLLERGIEIFGKSPFRLSQFIGSKSPTEVKYYLKNFYSETQTNYSGLNGGLVDETSFNNYVSDILDDTQIPASIEEVIAAVSTAKPTVPVAAPKKSQKKTNSFSSNDGDGGEINSEPKPRSPRLEIKKKSKVKPNRRPAKFKIKTKLKFPLKSVKQRTVRLMNHLNRKPEVGKVEITTGKGLAVPLCEGEQIVKICKDDTESDIEIDVDDSADVKTELVEAVKVEAPPVEKPATTTTTLESRDDESISTTSKRKCVIDLSGLDEHLMEQLTTLVEPQNEMEFNENFISELEKVVHSEFFEGRPTKTPLRYLKIRNHIVNCWLNSKPSYVTKTSIRQGLKNCGDVNCISRIHCYLEQIGAINFGCAQTTYLRPLHEVFQTVTNRDKNIKEIKAQIKVGLELGSRARIKRKFSNDGEGGCTLAHNERGDIINTTIVSEEKPKPKVQMKRPAVRLIYTRSFPPGHADKFKVKLDIMALLLMDFHSHNSLAEVMGLIAGTWNPPSKTLTISHYEPCKNSASSAIHCDMCPISQSKALDKIHGLNLNLLGWFHSHPTFAPEPSQQDVDTQLDFQSWIETRNPCVGMILTPFGPLGTASPFRCLLVDKKLNFEEQSNVPYKFHVELIHNLIDLKLFSARLKEILQMDVGGGKEKIDFSLNYFQDNSVTYLDKYVASVRMHLAKCVGLNKMTCDRIVECISKVCTNYSD